MAYVRCVSVFDVFKLNSNAPRYDDISNFAEQKIKIIENPLQNNFEYYQIIPLNWIIFILLQFLLNMQRMFFEHFLFLLQNRISIL